MNVKKIVDELINYDNKNNDSWNKTFKKIIKKYGDFSDNEEVIILRDTVYLLTDLGYDIEDYPFKLKKYR